MPLYFLFLLSTFSFLLGLARLQLAVADFEGFHQALQAAGLEAEAEPALALGRAAVGEGVGDGIALGLLLQAVVADGAGGAQSLFEVARLEDVLHLLRVVGP